jgi:LysR family transcriptional regulator, transcriptional activator of the cysJI operon
MESLYLKTLVEVVKSGSLSRAADTLCVTQPAVSRRIKFLEDQYGCELLDRTGPRLRPTEAGKLVCRKAEALLEIETEILTNLRHLDGRTRIAFGASAAFGIAHLPTVLREFMLDCGDRVDLSFVLQTPELLLAGLEDGRLDLAVVEMCECFDLSPWRTFALPDDGTVFASVPSLGVPHPETTIDALIDIPLFTRKEGCCSLMLLEANLRRMGYEIAAFRRTIVVEDLHVIVNAVLSGEGISFVSRDVVAEHLAAGRLLEHRVAGFRHTKSRALVLGRAEKAEAPIYRFLTKVFERFALPVPTDVTAAAYSARAEEASRLHGRPVETESARTLPPARRSRD